MIILLCTFAAFSSTFVACDSSSSSQSEEQEKGKEYTSAYVCPMHCAESGSDMAGECPACGMEYVVNEEHEADGHSH